MKKKLFLGFLAFILCFTLVGCGKDEENNDNLNNDETDSAKDYFEDLEMYSDNTKIVFQNENVKYVFYYSGEKITDYETYIYYDTVELANYALSVFERDESIKKVYTKGKYLVVQYAESEYEDLTVSSVKLAYSYMKEITK